MNIEIWSIGKENDAFINDGINYYFQKTRLWNPIELVVLQLPKKIVTTDVARTKLQEEDMLLKKLQPHHYLILLDERGKMLTSPLAGDVRRRGEIGNHHAGWHAGRVSPELRLGGLRCGDPLPPECLVLRFLPWSLRSPQDAVL